MPSPELAQIVALLRARPVNANPSLPDLRRGFDAMMSLIPVPADVKREALAVAGREAERLTPPDVEPGRAVLYLHGGGYVIGSIQSHRELAARVGRAARAEVLLVDYRLAPEHPFPAAIEDAVAAFRWVLAQGFDRRHVAIAGDSAGGGLTVATLLALRDAGGPLPAAAVCLSPWVDMEGTAASLATNAATDPVVQKDGLLAMARLYLGAADARDPRASPIHADLSGLPPMLVQVGKAETLLDDSVRLAERARAAGVDVTLDPWDDMIHVWQAFSMLPEAHRAVDKIGAFLRERLAGP
jgi:epsilon-lactone hydrolase